MSGIMIVPIPIRSGPDPCENCECPCHDEPPSRGFSLMMLAIGAGMLYALGTLTLWGICPAWYQDLVGGWECGGAEPGWGLLAALGSAAIGLLYVAVRFVYWNVLNLFRRESA